jgi:hypothetical protein
MKIGLGAKEGPDDHAFTVLENQSLLVFTPILITLFGYSFVFEIMMILNLVPSFAISSWGARRSDDQVHQRW